MAPRLSGASGSTPAHTLLYSANPRFRTCPHSFFGSLLPSSPSPAGGAGGGPMYVGTPSMDALVAHLLGSCGPPGTGGDVHLRQNTRVSGWGGAGGMLRGEWTHGRVDVLCRTEVWGARARGTGRFPASHRAEASYRTSQQRPPWMSRVLFLAVSQQHVCMHR